MTDKILYAIGADLSSMENGATDPLLIGEYGISPSNNSAFSQLATAILKRKMQQGAKDEKASYNQQNKFFFHYKQSGHFAYMCATGVDFPQKNAFSFLEDIEAQHLRQPIIDASGYATVLKERIAHHNSQAKNSEVSKPVGYKDADDMFDENYSAPPTSMVQATYGESLKEDVKGIVGDDPRDLESAPVMDRKNEQRVKALSVAISSIIFISCIISLVVLLAIIIAFSFYRPITRYT